MTDCGCDTARAKLEDYLHGELATQDCCDIEDHVKTCSPCGEELTIGQKLSDKVKKCLLRNRTGDSQGADYAVLGAVLAQRLIENQLGFTLAALG